MTLIVSIDYDEMVPNNRLLSLSLGYEAVQGILIGGRTARDEPSAKRRG